jgi:hypothetical protein
MPRPAPPTDIDIPSLRKQQVQRRNLMEVGPGTPWEDRGQLGTVPAFFRTCLMGITKPVRLTHMIRRPETQHDTRWFTVGCGALWGVSLIIHTALALWQASQQERTFINWGPAILLMGLQLVLAPLLLLVLVKLQVSLFNTLAATELKGQGPAVLVFNVFSYCLGPSLLALVPLVGPPLAVLWIFVAMVLVAMKRLYLGAASAIIGVILSLAVVLALAVGLYFAGGWTYELLTGGIIERLPIRTTPVRSW